MDNYTTLWNNKQRLAAGGYFPKQISVSEKYYCMRLLRKTDIILIAILAVFPLCMLAFNVMSAMKYTETRLVIVKDGETFGTYPLTGDRIIEIGDTNICEIRDGEVKMIHAECPDQICVHSAPISKYGGTIVCLPNKIILSIEDAQENRNSDAPDAVAR